MAQFDNPKSISLLFTGAFLVSLGVIAFFNVEMQSRSNHGTKIRNENLFEVLGKKLSQMVTSLKEKNSHRRSMLYQILVSNNSTRTPMRKLQFHKEDSNVIDRMELSQNRTFHRLRHEKKMRRLTELRLKQKLNATSSRDVTIYGGGNDIEWYRYGGSGNGNVGGNNVTVLNKSVNIGNIQWVKSSFNSTANNKTNENIFKEKLGIHQNCYTTNDVLEIIAITCLVNFIFWFLIISCVNIFTRNQKIWKSDSCESLTSVESSSDYELKKTGEESMARNPSNSHHNIDQECVTLLNIEEEDEERENLVEDPEALFVEKSSFGRKSSEWKDNTGRWNHRKLINLPNLLSDVISLDNIRPVTEKSFLSLNKSIPLTTATTTTSSSSFNSKKPVNSLSMENLIF